MSSEKMRFGLIGAGAIAHTYGQAFAQSTTAQLVGVVDVRMFHDSSEDDTIATGKGVYNINPPKKP